MVKKINPKFLLAIISLIWLSAGVFLISATVSSYGIHDGFKKIPDSYPNDPGVVVDGVNYRPSEAGELQSKKNQLWLDLHELCFEPAARFDYIVLIALLGTFSGCLGATFRLFALLLFEPSRSITYFCLYPILGGAVSFITMLILFAADRVFVTGDVQLNVIPLILLGIGCGIFARKVWDQLDEFFAKNGVLRPASN